MQIIHSCDAFAKRSGYESWAGALEVMRAGSIVSGYVPLVGKSTMDLRMFMEQVHKDGLLKIPVPHGDFCLARVGFRENFSAETLARFDNQSTAIEQRILGQYKTYQP